jgi:hypothetical protein
VVVGKISCIPRVENRFHTRLLKPHAYGLWLNSANSCEIFHFQLSIYNILLNQSQVAQIVVCTGKRDILSVNLLKGFKLRRQLCIEFFKRTYTRQVGQGRKRKTSRREDHLLSLQARRKRFVTAQHLRNDLQLATGTVISSRTVLERVI